MVLSLALGATGLAQTTPSVPRLANVSVLGYGGSGDQVLTVGFVLSGGVLPAPFPGFSTTGLVFTATELFVRAVGPGLGNFGVSGIMPNPSIAVFAGAQPFLYDDDWWNAMDAGRLLANEAAAVGAFPLVFGSLDAGASTSLSQGSYSMQVLPVGGSPGVALAEVYENPRSYPTNPTITNVSGRAQVGNGAGALTAGFTIKDDFRTLLVRAVGPALTAFGVGGVLKDPALAIYGRGAIVANNTGWQSGGQGAAISAAAASVKAFALTTGSFDSALIVTLPPGEYTAVLTSANGGSGVALVEVYDVSPDVVARETVQSAGKRTLD
jgi:hypothetical protein